MHALSGNIQCPASSAIRQILICPVQEQEPGGVVATVKGGEEQSSLTLSDNGNGIYQRMGVSKTIIWEYLKVEPFYADSTEYSFFEVPLPKSSY